MKTKEELMRTRGANLTKEEIIALGLRNKEIVDLKTQGKTYAEIAKIFNLHPGYIKTICHKHGVYGGVKPSMKLPEKQESLF